MAMRNTKINRAILLRKEGCSLSEISHTLDISKSTASLWLRGINLSDEALARINQKSNLGRRKALASVQRRIIAKSEERTNYATNVVSGVQLNQDGSRLMCALLYWCEGAKMRKRSTFAFTNSDPNLTRLFMRLFRENFPVNENKLRLQIHVHDYHNTGTQLQFWSKVTNIPIAQCNRPYQKPHTGKQTREGYQGCASIRYLDSDLARRLEAIAVVFLKNQGL